ncbi:DUF6950 family protein [Bartonella tamiae]|uniref:DUF6950 domain-containing protein n=1 Tax=Bartonella tamiae Th239 TaxID=1094558 RepID=J1K3H9_9HYPH|nr:hypothetical protein [Bartonella tamiae]EJF91690.1 hypothetical protein ME5_00069 [Bartonella tamiae Th239]
MRLWNRADGWAVALGCVVEKHNELPFQYGVSDCGQFAADAIEAVIGKDILKPYRLYRTKIGAARVLRKSGFLNLGALFAKHFKEGSLSLAMRGDIGVVDYQGELCAGVFTGTGFACKGENGIIFADYSQIERVFEVG